MSYYPAQYVYRYFSKIDPHVERRSSEETLAHDLDRAVEIVGKFSPDELRTVIKTASPDLVAALELLAEEAKSPAPIARDALPF